MKLILNSHDSFVAFGRSGSAVSENDTTRLFPLVQSAEISLDVNSSRQKSKFLGQSTYGINDIIKQPSVNVNLSYFLSPYAVNESVFGVYGPEENTMYSFFHSLKEYNNNIYIAFNNKMGCEGFSEPKDAIDGDFNEYSIISIGNCYLTRYAVDFSIGQPVLANVSFVGDNMIASYVSGDTVPVPSYDPLLGEPSSFYMDLADMYNNLQESIPNGAEGRTRYNPSVVRPYACEFNLSEIQCGGITLASGNKPILQKLSFDVQIDRTAYYNLGNNYPCTRKSSMPPNGSINMEFLISGIKSGDLNNLISQETGYSLSIICNDFVDPSISIEYEVSNARLENASYSCDIHGIYKCSMNFSFQDFGFMSNYASGSIWASTWLVWQGTYIPWDSI